MKMHTAAVCTLAGLSLAVAVPAAGAPVAYPVSVTADTSFVEGQVSTFEADGIPGCEGGTVTDLDARLTYTPWGGIYNGDKEFTCAGGEAGFTLHLVAKFGEPGSTGSWTLTDAWGGLEGVKASGSLVGFPTEDGITDVYTGRAR